MSSTADAGTGRKHDEHTEVGPVAAGRPVVDGTAASPERLRSEAAAEAERMEDPQRQRVEELRAEVAATADELSARFDVPARARAGKDRVVADLRAAGHGARERPAVLAAVGAGVLLLAVVGLRRRARRQKN
jgi:Protein of unknown function (DUF3618)